MNSYLEEGAWVSCSYDIVGAPQQIMRHLSTEENPVRSLSGKRFLTVADKNTEKSFKCKFPAKQWGGGLALLGGIAVGLTVVLLGPVGWVALGAVALVAIGTTVAVYNHDCAGPQSEGTWRGYHEKVIIKGEKAVLYNRSVLECAKGGLMIATNNLSDAQELSDAMKYLVRREVGAQILSNFIAGAVTGYGVVDVAERDQDISTVPLALWAYKHTDIDRANAGDSPFESMVRGSAFTAANFGLGAVHRIPGLPEKTRNFGTEPSSPNDLIVAGTVTAIGFASDTYEESLSKSTVETIKNAQVDFSGSTVIAVDD